MVTRVKYLIFGNGYVANYLKENMKGEVVISKERITEYYQVSAEIAVHKPDVVINCIGKTGNPNVDWCETHKEETFESNVRVAQLIKQGCEDHNVHLVHISTGCIFNGWVDETSNPNYVGSFYSRTKLMAEELVGEYEKASIIRIRLLISEIDSPRNILTKVKGFTKVTEQRGSMTFLKDLANAIPVIVEQKMYGPVNVMHPRACSIKELADNLGTKPQVVLPSELNIGSRADVRAFPFRLSEAGFKWVDFFEELKYCAGKIKDDN